MADNFVKTDLHIHSPASKCYKGNRDDQEYLNILSEAKKKELKVISITDHNSIEGYAKLIQIKSQLENKLELLKTITDSNQVDKELTTTQKNIELFQDILILPGIEFEVRNSIHLLVIFNNSTQLETIRKFINSGGYKTEDFGFEEPDSLSNWDIIEFLKEVDKYDCLVFDAHTDSSKGIMNTIQKGRLRASCFSSPRLNGVGYKSEKQKDQLATILKTSKDYNRKTPLAFLKFSDAHQCNDIGKEITYMKLVDLDFQSIKNAFENPTENITTEIPSVNKILTNLINKENSFFIREINKDSIFRIKQLCCALNNSNGGYILIGITEEKNRIGISIPVEKRKEYFDNLFDSIEEMDGVFIKKYTIYPLQGDKIIISIHIRPSNNLIGIRSDYRIYTISSGQLKILTANEIQQLIEKRHRKEIEDKVSKELHKIETNLHNINLVFQCLPIIRKFENNSISLATIVEIKIVNPIKIPANDSRIVSQWIHNGNSRGNVIYVSEFYEPRLNQSYLRYSPPLFSYGKYKDKPPVEDCIIISPGGAAYFSNKIYPNYNKESIPLLYLKTLDPNYYPDKFIAAFLKSSFCLWYILHNYEKLDLHIPQIYNGLKLPAMDKNDRKRTDNISEIESLVDQIIKKEKNTLVIFNKEVDEKKYAEIIDKHNIEVDKLAYKIDSIIYKILSINDSEVKVIEDYLRTRNIYIPEKV